MPHGGLRYSLPEVCAKPRCTNTSRSGPTPAASIRSTAPVHKPVSGICAFFTNTNTSVPRSASATSCTLNGLPVVRAPIHTISAPAPRAASTWRELATSTPERKPRFRFRLRQPLQADLAHPLKTRRIGTGFPHPSPYHIHASAGSQSPVCRKRLLAALDTARSGYYHRSSRSFCCHNHRILSVAKLRIMRESG